MPLGSVIVVLDGADKLDVEVSVLTPRAISDGTSRYTSDGGVGTNGGICPTLRLGSWPWTTP